MNTAMTRTDTAHLAWDDRWKTEQGRADWLVPDPEVAACAERLAAAGPLSALDLGCGVGRHALMMAGLGMRTSALDGSEAGIAEVQNTARARGLDIDAHVGLMTDLPFPDASFDYVVAFNVIYHGDRKIVSRAIDEIRRVLKPGGTYQGTMLSMRHEAFGVGDPVDVDTYIKGDDGERAHPHFYCDAGGLISLFEGFELRSLVDREHKRPGTWHWHMIAEKRP